MSLVYRQSMGFYKNIHGELIKVADDNGGLLNLIQNQKETKKAIKEAGLPLPFSPVLVRIDCI